MSVYTATATLNIDQVAYDRVAYFAYAQKNYFDAIADVKGDPFMPGNAVTFTKFGLLAANVTPLNEITDVNLTAMADSQVTVTLVEYGDAVGTTAKLRGTSFLDIDAVAARLVGDAAGRSLDKLAFNTLVAGTNVIYPGAIASRVTVAAGTVLLAADIRETVALMREAFVPTFGEFYVGFMHPRVAYDLMGATTGDGWRQPHNYVDPNNIYLGEVGAFEGVRWIITASAPPFVDTGVGGTVDVYPTIIVGQQGLAKAFSTIDGNSAYPKVVVAPPVDNLQRLNRIGWYWLGGYGIFRQESIRRIESSSSIGAN